MISAPEYQVGLDSESRLIFLCNLERSSKSENIYQDIDARDRPGFTFSIKAQEIAAKTQNFAFELETEDFKGQTKQSWYYTGKADYYLILVGNTVYQIKRHVLNDYIHNYGWDKITRLSQSTKNSQRKIGHSHVNATLGLISIRRCVDAGLISKQFTIPS